MRLKGTAIMIALLFLAGCQQEQNVPSAADFANEREKLVKRVADRKAKKASAPKATVKAPKSGGKTGEGFAPSGSAIVYEPSVYRDPFRSFEWERLALEDDSLRGPLEQYDVSQLEVAAVVWKTGSARALVKDPAGQSYIIGVGARVGKNDGTVTLIDDSLIVVKETYVDYLGHETKKDVELRIRRTEGG